MQSLKNVTPIAHVIGSRNQDSPYEANSQIGYIQPQQQQQALPLLPPGYHQRSVTATAGLSTTTTPTVTSTTNGMYPNLSQLVDDQSNDNDDQSPSTKSKKKGRGRKKK